MHVLIATDGSEESIAAARRGRALLADADHMTVLSVITDGYPDDDAGGIEGPLLTPEEQVQTGNKRSSKRTRRSSTPRVCSPTRASNGS